MKGFIGQQHRNTRLCHAALSSLRDNPLSEVDASIPSLSTRPGSYSRPHGEHSGFKVRCNMEPVTPRTGSLVCALNMNGLYFGLTFLSGSLALFLIFLSL
jgi:hypothetical protein